MTISVLIIAFLVTLLIGVPVVWSLGLSAIAVLYLTDLSLPSAWLSQQLFRGADSLILASVPLFLFAGSLMNEGGLMRRIMVLAEDIFGCMHGGLGLVNVATAMVYGGVSGSATADTGAVASILVPAMEERGYPKAFAAAVTAASGTLGIIIPPSVILILYGVITNTSIGGLFVAGFIPGTVIGVAFMITAYLSGRFRGFPKLDKRPKAKDFFAHLLDALPALIMPIVVIGSMVGGIATATEAAAVAVVYSFIVGILVYRELSLKALPKLAFETVVVTGAIMIILAAATPFSWILTIEQVPTMTVDLVKTMSLSPEMTIVCLVLLLLFVGLWMDLGPALIILAPIIKPLGLTAGLGSFQLGMIVTVALGIGLFTPPVGTNIFVVCNVARLSISSIMKELVPYWLTGILCLVIITVFPSLTEWLPRVMGF